MKESSLQIAVARYLDQASNMVRTFTWSHPANEGKRSRKNGAHLKLQGLKPGEADCIIMPVAMQAFFIELKVKGRYLEKSQKARKEEVEALGFKYHVVKAEHPIDAVNQVEAILQKEGVL